MAAPSTQAKTNTFKTIPAVSFQHLIPGPSHKTSIGTHGGRNHSPHPSEPGCSPPAAEGSDLAREREVRAQHHPSLLWPSHGQPSTLPSATEKGSAGTGEHRQSRGQRDRKPPRASPRSPRPPRAGAVAQEASRRLSRDQLLSRMLCAQG